MPSSSSSRWFSRRRYCAKHRRSWQNRPHCSESRQQERRSVAETNLERQLAQRRQELAEAQARVQSLEGQLVSAREALAIEARLNAQGAGARSDHSPRERFDNIRKLDGARIAVGDHTPRRSARPVPQDETQARYQAESSRERAKPSNAPVAERAAHRTGKMRESQRAAGPDGQDC